DGSVTDAIICQTEYNNEVHIDNCIFNAASSITTYQASYIHITESKEVTIRNSQFNAVRLGRGAALVFGSLVNVSIIENTNFTGIVNNDGYGSALNLEIHTEFGNHILDHVIFQSCSAQYGGAVYVDLGERQAIQSNAEFRTIQFIQCDFLNTNTTEKAAVFFKDAGSVVDITKCRFVNNTAPSSQTTDVYFEYKLNKDSMREERFKGSHSNSLPPKVQLNEDGIDYDYLLPPFPSDIYVSQSIGSDSTGDGSRDKPYRTVQYALEIAEPYSSFINIIILDGELWENALWLRSRPITIQSDNRTAGRKTIGRLSSVDSALATIGDSSLTFGGLIIGDTGTSTQPLLIVDGTGAFLTIQSSEFQGQQSLGNSLIDARRGSLEITNSKFNDLILSDSAAIKISGLTNSSLSNIEAINVIRSQGNGAFIEYLLENAISSTHTLDQSIFINCLVNDASEGGAISINRGFISSQANVNISRSEFEHNTAGFGGSIQIIGTQANLYFVNDTFADGVAHNELLYQGFDIFIGLEVLPMMNYTYFVNCTSSSQHKRVGMRIYQIDDSYDREFVLPDYKGIYYVSNSGDDIHGTGSIARPFKTIQRAHQVLYSVDTNNREIYVCNGTYGQGQTESVTDIGSHEVHIYTENITNPIIQVLNVTNPDVIRRNPFFSVGNGSLHLENLDFEIQPSTRTEAELIRLTNNGKVTLTGCNVRSSEPFVSTRSNHQSSSWIHGVLTRGGIINIINSDLNNEIFKEANALLSDGTSQVNIQGSTFNNLINNGGRGSAINANIYIDPNPSIITNFTITGSKFINCEAREGGAIAFNLGPGGGAKTGQYLKIIDNNFNNNKAQYGGSIVFEGAQ
ncbi:MAG: hypothetical protein EZS28_034478, partial [Streblomastix strix]